MVLDPVWIFPEEIVVHQLFDRRVDGLRTPLDDGFTPADDAISRLDAEKEPPWRHLVQIVVGDFGH